MLTPSPSWRRRANHSLSRSQYGSEYLGAVLGQPVRRGGEVALRAVAGVDRRLTGGHPGVVLGLVEHWGQARAVRRAGGHVRGDDDLRRLVDHRLAVVGLDERPVGVLHDVRVRVGEVALRGRLGCRPGGGPLPGGGHRGLVHRGGATATAPSSASRACRSRSLASACARARSAASASNACLAARIFASRTSRRASSPGRSASRPSAPNRASSAASVASASASMPSVSGPPRRRPWPPAPPAAGSSSPCACWRSPAASSRPTPPGPSAPDPSASPAAGSARTARPARPGVGDGTSRSTGSPGPARRPGSGRRHRRRSAARSPDSTAPRSCNRRPAAEPSPAARTAGTRAPRCSPRRSRTGRAPRRPARRPTEPSDQPAATRPGSAAGAAPGRARTAETSWPPASSRASAGSPARRRTAPPPTHRNFPGGTPASLGSRSACYGDTLLARQGAGPGPADPDVVPYYLLIVGDPGSIPYSFQYQLDVQYAVGRLHFDRVEDYASYARSVLAAETGQVLRQPRLQLFATHNRSDSATQLSSSRLVTPLAASLRDARPDWKVQACIGEEATKRELSDLLRDPSPPALLFTATHGIGFPAGHPRQRHEQGALLCQDWPGPLAGLRPLGPDQYFAAEDVGTATVAAGLIAFHFACFGAGTPQWDEFADGRRESRPRLAADPFVAALPKRLLAHERGGALAA